jgi:predicted N-acetyltransferase YhbS
MTVIRALTEADLPEAQRIVRVAFGTFLGAPDPERFWSDLDYVYSRFGAEHTASFAADNDEGRLVGSNFATRWGSVGFFGPLTTRPELWDAGIGQRLVAAACDQLDTWGVQHAGLFTFAQSAKHVGLYGKFGFYPRFLTAIMAAPADAQPMTSAFSRYSALPDDLRQQAENACRDLTGEIYPGLDLGGEIRTAAARSLGDTALVWDRDNRLAGFAVCQWGTASEAGQGFCFAKFAAVRSGPGAGERFGRLLDTIGMVARHAGMPNVLAGVNLAREEAYRQMLARGFRTMIQGVTMHRPNEPAYSAPGLYVLDDWR